MGKVVKSATTAKRGRTAMSPEARENQMIALAVDLVEQRMIAGTASSQETTHFLKLGSMKNRLEMEKLKRENELLRAKAEMINSQKKSEELLEEAIRAMREYSGHRNSEDYSEDDRDEY